MFGNPETTPGGRALKFYSSIRIDLRRLAALTSGDKIIGNRVKVKIVKNKVAPPFKIAEIDIIYDEGISFAGSLLDMGIELGIIDKSGSWISYGDLKLGQGKDNARQFLKENEKAAKEIENKIRESFEK